MAKKDHLARREDYSPELASATERSLRPPVDIYENEQEFLLLADLPGVDASSLAVELDGQELRIRGQRPVNGDAALTYQRVFTVGSGLDPEGIHAHLENGVLQVTAKKSDAVRPRKIEVRAS